MKVRSIPGYSTLILALLLFGLLLNYHKDIIQYLNTRELIKEELDGRLVVHRVNHLDKLSYIVKNGLRSVEIDLLFRNNDSGNFFEVGHDETTATNVSLTEFLSILKSNGDYKIWLDLKNLTDNNVTAVVSELIYLDSIYDFKQRAIIESGLISSELSQFSTNQFHLSYYLPTTKIIALQNNNDTLSLRHEAERIRLLLENRNHTAVSFNLALYPFVKKYLEPVISTEIVYHVWDSIKLWEWGAFDRLKETEYYSDKRVHTILCRYW